MISFFCFQGNNYGKGTVIKIYEKHQDEFKFYSTLVFEGCDNQNGVCYFRALCNSWDRFEILECQLSEYIEMIIEAYDICIQTKPSPKVSEDYIEGIASAWIWYILIMIFGLFLKGPINMIGTWILASIIFFSWRHKKMNGE